MDKVIECPCGYLVRAGNDAELVQQAQVHAQKAHEMVLSSDEALAMARPE